METQTKRVSYDPQTAVLEQTRTWDAMIPEILSLIFKKITPVDEMVRSVTLVCRGWMETVAGPYCWGEIDVEQWCRRHWHSGESGRLGGLLIDSVVRRLVRRSKCTFKKISAYRLGDPGFSYVANCGRCLEVLQIPVSEITDQMVLRHAKSLVNLTELDISYCLKITARGIEAFGKHCKSLTHLKRNLPPLDLGPGRKSFPIETSKTDDHEAITIANNMAGLQHLELGFSRLTDRGLNAVITQCEALSYLNIEGCWNVSLEGDLQERCQRLSFFIRPCIEENGSEGFTENDSTEADNSSDESSH